MLVWAVREAGGSRTSRQQAGGMLAVWQIYRASAALAPRQQERAAAGRLPLSLLWVPWCPAAQ